MLILYVEKNIFSCLVKISMLRFLHFLLLYGIEEIYVPAGWGLNVIKCSMFYVLVLKFFVLLAPYVCYHILVNFR